MLPSVQRLLTSLQSPHTLTRRLLPSGAAELEDQRCDRCSSLSHQFRGLYEGGSPALLRQSGFALRTSALLLVGDLKKPLDHNLDSGFIPGSRPPWRSLCLVKQTLSTLLRFLLEHQAASTESAQPLYPRLALYSPLADRPTLRLDVSPGNFAPCTFHLL
ncbi:hypothetical protein AMECASPLE_036937 [Ameca splendens]|uniref:Uncharacterized protein n=1 Tax=Ameca splendens TaxID=208324 RepID=A0ABV1AFZ0_9TELE